MHKGPRLEKAEEQESPQGQGLRDKWQAQYLGQVGERMPWEELALGVAEYSELLQVIQTAFRKEFLSAQSRAFRETDADVWRRLQGVGSGLEIALEAIVSLEQALAEKEAGDV